MKDYLAIMTAEAKDMKQAGVKGMKWGVRRDRATLRAAAKKQEAKPGLISDLKVIAGSKSEAQARRNYADADKNEASVAEQKRHEAAGRNTVVVGAASGETSSARYDRLAGQAKSGRASDMTEQDLKFFNARTEALNKVAKMNEVQPTWLAATTKKVIQQTAQNQMQSLADGLANKYIGDPIKDALKGGAAVAAASKPSAAPKTAASKPSAAPKTAEAVKDVVSTAVKTTTTTAAAKPPGMTREQSLQYFRDNPPPTAMPKGYSPSGNFDLFKTLREEGLID